MDSFPQVSLPRPYTSPLLTHTRHMPSPSNITFTIYFVLCPTNAQLFHKLSHSYMFRHYRIILRDPVINTLPSYTSISNPAVGNTIYNEDISQRFHEVLILESLKCQYYKIYVKYLNCKLYYQQLHLKYLCNLARYWLQAP